MFGHQLVMCDVDKQLFLHENLEVIWVETLKRLYRHKQTKGELRMVNSLLRVVMLTFLKIYVDVPFTTRMALRSSVQSGSWLSLLHRSMYSSIDLKASWPSFS